MSQLNWKNQALLAGTLFALGAGAFFLEYKHKPKKEAEEEQAKKLFQVKDVAVEAMRLEMPGKVFSFSCLSLDAKLCKPGDNSHWQIVAPSKVRGDDANVNALVSALNNLNSSETIDLKEETPEKRGVLLKEYGLDAASRKADSTRRIVVKTKDGETTLYLGGTHPIGDSYFGLEGTGDKVDETKIFLVPNYLKTHLEHDLTYWRDKKLVTIGAHDIASFDLEGPKASLRADKKEGQWTLHLGKTRAEEAPGDIENIDNLLTSVAYLTAKSFTSDDKNDDKAKETLKGAKPVLTLVLNGDKGGTPPVTVTLLQKADAVAKKTKKEKDASPAAGKLYATVSNLDPLFELENYSLERLNKEPKDLRLVKLITSMDRFAIKRIEASGGDLGKESLQLNFKDGKWTRQPAGVDIDQEKVSGLLDKLSGNRIKDFLNGAAIPKGEDKAMRLWLGDEKGEKKRELAFWFSSDKLYARDLMSKRPEAFLVDSAIKDGLPWHRDAFNKAAAAAVPAGTPPAVPALGKPAK